MHHFATIDFQGTFVRFQMSLKKVIVSQPVIVMFITKKIIIRFAAGGVMIYYIYICIYIYIPGSPKPIFKIVVPTTTIFEHTPFFPKSGFYHSRTDLATSFFLPLGKLRFFLPLTAFSKAHLRRCLQQPTPYSQNKLESAVASGNTTSHMDFTDFTDHLWIYLGNPRNKSRLTTNSRIPVPSLCFSVFNYHHKKKRGKTSKVAVFGEIVFHAKKRSFTKKNGLSRSIHAHSRSIHAPGFFHIDNYCHRCYNTRFHDHHGFQGVCPSKKLKFQIPAPTRYQIFTPI